MIHQVEMHSAECDICESIFEESGTGFTAFPDESVLQEEALLAGWVFVGKACFCPICHEANEDGSLLLRPAPKSISEQIAEDLGL